jgi:flagellar hook assembly protein FlgD
MATIDSSSPVIGPATPTQPKTTAPKANDAMGKDQFLQLLVAQMKNQDPLNPANGQEMAAQLAQFSSVEQLQNANDTLAKIRELLAATSAPAPTTPAGGTGGTDTTTPAA